MAGRFGFRFVVGVSALLVTAACATSPNPAPQPLPSTPTPASALLTLSPVPLTLTVPLTLAASAWVAPLTGSYVDELAPEAAVQLQYRAGTSDDLMVGNLFWFTVQRYDTLMAGTDAPTGIELGTQAGHVLFVQPALDMPLEPSSAEAAVYGALVERARAFRSYDMSDPSLTLMRP